MTKTPVMFPYVCQNTFKQMTCLLFWPSCSFQNTYVCDRCPFRRARAPIRSSMDSSISANSIIVLHLKWSDQYICSLSCSDSFPGTDRCDSSTQYARQKMIAPPRCEVCPAYSRCYKCPRGPPHMRASSHIRATIR